MNKKQLKYILSFSFIIVLAGIVACEGPAGSQGSQGPRGEQGPQGEEGTANVIYSDWMLLEDFAKVDTTFSLTGGSNQNVTKYDVPAQELTQEIIMEGSVLMFARFGSSRPVVPLPFTFPILDIPYEIAYALPEPELIWVYVNRLDNNPISLLFVVPLEIRYVLVPGGIPSAKMPAGFWEDYEAVTEYLRIPD